MNRFAFLSVGFRPWFISLLVAGLCLFGVWGWVWFALGTGRGLGLPLPIGTVVSDWRWHAHEMIFGLGVALLSGFLLTAVRNWTGVRLLSSRALLATVAVWWSARLLLLLSGMSGWAGFILSAAVPLWVAIVILRPILEARQWRNLIFPVVLVTLSLLDCLFRAEMHASDFRSGVAWAGLWPLVAVVLFMAQRIIPSFTGNFIGRRDLDLGQPLAVVFGGGPFLLLLLGLLPFFVARTVLLPLGAMMLVLFGAHALGHWWDRRVLREPMLAVLFVGFLLVLSGVLILAIAQSPTLPVAWRAQWVDGGIHALGLGVMGVFGPGMVLRVSAGHTGRAIRMPRVLRAAFIVAVLLWGVRTATLGIGLHPGWLALSAWGMAGVYLALLLSIGPWLVRPRVDE